MTVREDWPRIAGVHLTDDGTLAAIWLAHDRTADTAHLYDAALFRREVIAVVAEGMAARDRKISVAWHKEAKPFVEQLLDRGIRTLPEPAEDSEEFAEVVSREIWSRMRTGRFKVDRRLSEVLDELKEFRRDDQKIPIGRFPLMAAIRHAMACFDYARPLTPIGAPARDNFAKIAIV